VPRGGRRPGAGRKRLAPEKREEIAREYHRRMTAWSLAQARTRNPNVQKRRQLDAEMREVAKTFALPDAPRDEDLIHYHLRLGARMDKLQREIDSTPDHRPPAKLRRAKGPRDRIVEDLAEEYGVSQRMVIRCINEFDFGT
jgi:hypothetical protein